MLRGEAQFTEGTSVPRNVDLDRRRFLGAAAATAAATQLGAAGPADARTGNAGPGDTPTILTPQPEAHTSFASIKQIDAGVLNVGYAEAGPADGRVAILLHGWPYDIYSYVDVAPILAAAGYRVIVPYLRGFGPTRFLSKDTFRNGEQVVLAIDIVALMDALKIKSAVVGGFDWGTRTANIMAALWPDRVKGLVSVSGYGLPNIKAQAQPLPPEAELFWWYQFYFNTERGRLGYSEYRHDFNKLIWKLASPKWNFSDATYDRTAASFNNPDHVDITIHNYRCRYNWLEKGDAKYAELEEKLQLFPVLSVPTITMASDFDGAGASGVAYRNKYSGKYAHRILQGIGHNVPQEAPQAFAQAVIDVDRFS
jgi:pimeloyl-ACP methyl ester carboxylesterase